MESINPEQLATLLSQLPALSGQLSPGTLYRQLVALQQNGAATAPTNTAPAPAPTTHGTATPMDSASCQKPKSRRALATMDPNATPMGGAPRPKAGSAHHPMQRIKLSAASPLMPSIENN